MAWNPQLTNIATQPSFTTVLAVRSLPSLGPVLPSLQRDLGQTLLFGVYDAGPCSRGGTSHAAGTWSPASLQQGAHRKTVPNTWHRRSGTGLKGRRGAGKDTTATPCSFKQFIYFKKCKYMFMIRSISPWCEIPFSQQMMGVFLLYWQMAIESFNCAIQQRPCTS
jgi:hypothetical protein